MSIYKSTNPKKKYMVKVTYQNKTKTIHFGATGYKDYIEYYKEEGKDQANKKKSAYVARHKVNEDFNNPLTSGFWSVRILWNLPSLNASLKDTLNKFPNMKLEKN